MAAVRAVAAAALSGRRVTNELRNFCQIQTLERQPFGLMPRI